MNILTESNIDSPQTKARRNLRALFVTTTVSGVAYYRMCQYAWNMRSWPGVETVVWPYSKDTTMQNGWQVDMLENPEIRSLLYRLVECADIVIWQQIDFEPSFELWLDLRARFQKPFLMEVDDYLLDIPVENEAFDQMRPGSRRRKIAMEQMRQSDAVICSTPYLASQYKGMNEVIYVIPNCIDFAEWDKAARRKGVSDRIRIGWIGGGTHSADLEMVRPVIEDITQTIPNVWFYVIHGVPNSYKKLPHVYWTHRWSKINLYPRFMASFKFDIGIAPLVDNNFNRGKSNLRWLEYSALKIPCIASPLPDFSRVIETGKTGFIADSQGDWFKWLDLLVRNAQLRESVGKQAYAKVKKDFNTYKMATRYMRLLKGIANGEFPANEI